MSEQISEQMSGKSVVLLHGLWMPAAEMWFCRRHLERSGYRGHLFGYPSVRATLDENADLLIDFLASLEDPPVAIVAHSLGGIVALRALARGNFPEVKTVVCLGSPLGGSKAAETLSSFALGRRAVGSALPEGILRESVADWANEVLATRKVGVIAGSQSAGLGRFVARFDEPNDGTVAVRETRIDGLADHCVLPVSHSGMVLSSRVADEVMTFIERGQFSKDR